VALYRAKSEERGTFHFFTEKLHQDVCRRVNLLTELRKGIEHHELCLVYQPQVDMNTRAIVGLEALVRWHHPSRGLVSPAEFIPAAENSGLIISLGSFVIGEACRQAREWQELGIDVPVIAVNVSPTQLKVPAQFNAEVFRVLRENGIQPERFEIEL